MKIWICSDLWMDILPFFRRPQIGLKMALISPRFEVLVDAHFDGKTELTLWRAITIRKDIEMPKLFVEGKSEGFPVPDRPLPNKIIFKHLRIEYIDHSVISFLHANQQIWDRRGTELYLSIWTYKRNIQPIWDVFVRQIWPIFATNIRHFGFSDGHHLNNLLRITSPTFRTDFNQLNSIYSDYLFVGVPNAPSVGQALFEWLHTPTKDGQPKRLCCKNDGTRNLYKWISNFKEPFLRATTSACFKIRLKFFESTEIGAFELVNERTNEMLTLEKEGNDDANMEKDDEYEQYTTDDWLLKRCKIGKTIQWEDKKTDNLNNVDFMIFEFGRLSPPNAGQKNAKCRPKMSAGPSERKSE